MSNNLQAPKIAPANGNGGKSIQVAPFTFPKTKKSHFRGIFAGKTSSDAPFRSSHVVTSLEYPILNNSRNPCSKIVQNTHVMHAFLLCGVCVGVGVGIACAGVVCGRVGGVGGKV